MDYITDPAEIQAQSYLNVAQAVDLSKFDEAERAVITRMLITTGVVEIAQKIEFSPNAVDAAVAALKSGARIICDTMPVRSGIKQASLVWHNELICPMRRHGVTERAKEGSITRAQAGLEIAKDEIGGSIMIVGNAPTALFRLLELLEEGLEPPQVIIGMPVGFVDAENAKKALAELKNVPFITLHGPMGGPTAASTAMNALIFLAATKDSDINV